MGSLLLACSGASGAAGGDGAGGDRNEKGERAGCTAQALEQCAPHGIEGIDVFDGQGAIDWAAVARSGVSFAMIKATQGTYDTQATFGTNWQGARSAGIPRGAYHFFDPNEDGAAQAQRFLAVVGPLEPGDLPPMLDIECPDGDPDCLGTTASGAAASGSGPAPAIAQRMWAWIRLVEATTGTKPIVYTFASYFASNGIDATGLDAYPLFLAQPASTAAGSDACFTVPAPWSAATMWQYSWSGAVPGVDVPVDRDRFLGSQAALQALAVGQVAGPGDAGPSGAVGGGVAALEAGPAGGAMDGSPAVGDGGEVGAMPGSPGCF